MHCDVKKFAGEKKTLADVNPGQTFQLDNGQICLSCDPAGGLHGYTPLPGKKVYVDLATGKLMESQDTFHCVLCDLCVSEHREDVKEEKAGYKAEPFKEEKTAYKK